MRFELDDEHYEFADVVDGALTAIGSTARARRILSGDVDAVDGERTQLIELGVPGLTVPERLGGSGLPAADCVLVLEVLGRHLVPDAVALGFGAVAPELAADGSLEAEGLLKHLAVDPLAVSVQEGWSGWAPWAADVSYVAVVEPDGVTVVSTGGGVVVPVDGTDPARRLGRVGPGGEVIMRLDAGAARRMRARAVATTAVVLAGVARAMIDMAAGYAQERRQFGSPIGAFQGVKHQLADAYAAVEGTRRTGWWAAWCLETDASDSDEAAATAKATIGDAARLASTVALQVHGGIGFTAECDLNMWLKRNQALEAAWGGPSQHWRWLRERQV